MKKFFNIFLVMLIALFVFSPEVLAETANCPLGPDVTKDLHGLLKVINYGAPILLIAFTVIDAMKTITNGDAIGNTKPMVKKFLKRLLYTAILFFIPVLVDQFMIMAGVWDEGGGCKLDEPTDNGHEDSDLTKPEDLSYINGAFEFVVNI